MTGLIYALLLAAQAEVPPVRAVARGNLGALVMSNDYPARALARRADGTVYFDLDVSAEGRVTACRVTRSSGEPSLDERTCRIMRTRARFRPARDSSGNPVADVYSSMLAWRLF